MGLFSKIKQNIKHGGVKIYLQAPSTISADQTTVDVVVTLVVSEPCQVDKIEGGMERRYYNTGSNDSSTANNSNISLGMVTQSGPIQLTPGQNYTYNLSFSIGSNEPQSAGGQAVSKIMDGLSALSSQSYNHYIYAKADVANIALDPKANQQVTWESHENTMRIFG